MYFIANKIFFFFFNSAIGGTRLRLDCPCSPPASTYPQEPSQAKKHKSCNLGAFSAPCSSSWGDLQSTAADVMTLQNSVLSFTGHSGQCDMTCEEKPSLWCEEATILAYEKDTSLLSGRVTFPTGRGETKCIRWMGFTVRVYGYIILEWLGIRD